MENTDPIVVKKPKGKTKKRKFKNLMKELTSSSNNEPKTNEVQIKQNTGGGQFSKLDRI